jgi:ribosomal protein L16 Arg81 hydroxylase
MSVCDDIIAPLDARRFFDDCWDQRATYIEGDENKFRDLYCTDGDRWVEFADELEAATQDEHGVQHQFPIAPEQVRTHFSNGMTICANVTRDPTLTPTLFRFASELALPGSPFAKIYASPNNQGFALHLDSFHVFVCQLVGSKRWRYSATPAVQAPIYSGKVAAGRAVWSAPLNGEPMMDDGGAFVEVPNEDDLEEAILTPGDCLYLPPGTWHVARAVGRSVALSISPPRTPVYELISKTLEDHLTMRAEWRRDVFAPNSDEAVPPAVAQMFRDRIADLRGMLDTLDQRTLHRVWRINASAHERAETIEPTPLSDESVLKHVGDKVRRYLVAPHTPGGGDAIHFYAGGSEWSLPITARAFIEALVENDTFTAKNARTFDASLSEEDVREILSELLAAGLLARQ